MYEYVAREITLNTVEESPMLLVFLHSITLTYVTFPSVSAPTFPFAYLDEYVARETAQVTVEYILILFQSISLMFYYSNTCYHT